MVLRYMVSDIDLAKGEVVQPEKEVAQPKARAARRERKVLSPKTRKRLWLLLLANVIMWGIFCYFWNAEKKPAILEFFTMNRITVTGVIYNPENPSAIVHGKVVHEGDTVGRYKVVKIYRNKVEFEKNGKIHTEQVHK